MRACVCMAVYLYARGQSIDSTEIELSHAMLHGPCTPHARLSRCVLDKTPRRAPLPSVGIAPPPLVDERAGEQAGRTTCKITLG